MLLDLIVLGILLYCLGPPIVFVAYSILRPLWYIFFDLIYLKGIVRTNDPERYKRIMTKRRIKDEYYDRFRSTSTSPPSRERTSRCSACNGAGTTVVTHGVIRGCTSCHGRG